MTYRPTVPRPTVALLIENLVKSFFILLGFRPPAPRSRSAPRTATMSGAAVRPFVSPSLDVIHHGWSAEAEEQAAASSPSLLTMTATFNPEIDVGTTEVVFVPRFAAGHTRQKCLRFLRNPCLGFWNLFSNKKGQYGSFRLLD